jgi:hypothetical protein
MPSKDPAKIAPFASVLWVTPSPNRSNPVLFSTIPHTRRKIPSIGHLLYTIALRANGGVSASSSGSFNIFKKRFMAGESTRPAL